MLLWILAGILVFSLILLLVQLKRCPSNRLLLIRNRLLRWLGQEAEVQTHHGGMYLVWPLLQEHRFLDLSPMKVSVDLSECTERDVREPTTYYFKACLDLESDGDEHDLGRQFWNRERKQIQQELKQRTKTIIRNELNSGDGAPVNEERNTFLVELEETLNRKLVDYGFRLLTISHKS